MNQRGALVAHRYRRSNGRPRAALIAILRELDAAYDLRRIGGVSLTGSGGEAIARVIGCRHVNELVAQTRAVGAVHPEARSVIEIGGQDSKFLALAWDAAAGQMRLVDFAMNSLCAAGTGSFLDQQAERLGLAIEEEFATIQMTRGSVLTCRTNCVSWASCLFLSITWRCAR